MKITGENIPRRSMRAHLLADIFPPLIGKAFSKLARHIARTKQIPPVVVYEDAILDGRAVVKICEIHRLEIPYVPFAGTDPVEFLINRNLPRCLELTQSQRAMIAAKLGRHIRDPARMRAVVGDLRISSELVGQAQRILEAATPREIKAVSEGRDTVTKIFTRLQARAPLKPGRKPALKPLPIPTPRKTRSESARERAAIWHHLKGGLDNILSLPAPVATAEAIGSLGNVADKLGDRLPRAIAYLEALTHEWTRIRADARRNPGRDRADHSGNSQGSAAPE